MKLFTILFISSSLLFACSAPSKESTNNTSEQLKNTKLIEAYFTYFNAHDWNKMAEMYADTSSFKDPSLGDGIVKQSRQDIAIKYAALQEMIPDVRDEVIHIYPSGQEHIIVEFISHGTSPDNTPFALPICTIFKIENNKITQDFTYYDNF
jgi:ketosteroid isomerase-like protein